MAQFMKGSCIKIEIDAGHWLISENPSLVLPKIATHIVAHQSIFVSAQKKDFIMPLGHAAWRILAIKMRY